MSTTETPDADASTIDGQLCFALHSASRAMTASYRRGLDALGLTYSQYVVMLLLWEHGAVSMGFLCDELHLDSGTLSPLLKRLEKQGLVTRRRRPEDERTLEVACTDEGHALRDRVSAVQADVQRDVGMSASEIAALRSELVVLADRLRAATAREGEHPA